MSIICDKKNCCGCQICSIACPRNAIEIRVDRLGFPYPIVDQEKCVRCGICSRICPGLHVAKDDAENKQFTYAAYSQIDSIKYRSSSGGLFWHFANRIIEDSGVVCGCTLKEDFSIEHIIVSKKEDLILLQGSKYAQSDVSRVFPEIKQFLMKKTKVLFCGTPCQVYALKKYVGSSYPKYLFCIDLICHGVPSEKMFMDYIADIERRNSFTVNRYVFRDKKYGWAVRAYAEVKRKHDNSISNVLLNDDYYYKYFLWGYLYNECCYGCRFANMDRQGDVTLGDFWGIEDYVSCDENLKHGTSMVIINTEKGKRLFESIPADEIVVYSTPLDFTISQNHQLERPTNRNLLRYYFLKLQYILGGSSLVGRIYRMLHGK